MPCWHNVRSANRAGAVCTQFVEHRRTGRFGLAEFPPTFAYPARYGGRDGGTQDPAQLATLSGVATTVELHKRYGEFLGLSAALPK